jgi:hypothetical protein
MSRFLNETISDIRGGRETWRVFIACCAPALAAAVAMAIR